jgi:dihydrolipoamide dehydrogenase
MKFKLNTKVISGDDSGEGVKLEVEAAKGGKPETVGSLVASIFMNKYTDNIFLARR